MSEAKVACIGPAGENSVLMAAIMNDKHRAAARSGVGAVMGSKNLKGVVAMGKKNPAFFDDAGMRKFSLELNREVGADIKKGSSLREYGTAYVPQVTNTLGILPTRNFQTGVFEGVDNIDGVALKEKYLIQHTPCYRCPISCGRLTAVDDEKYAGKGEGPEYETIASLGSACGVDNLAALTKANYWCNELGMDTITTGLTIAAAMEMYENGIIDDSDHGRPAALWRCGCHDRTWSRRWLIGEGFGDELAEGSYRLAEKYDHPEIAVTARKQEFPGYDPRGSQGMGLLYATSNKGASHMEGDVAYEEVFGVPVKSDRLSTDGKGELVARCEDAFALIDSGGICVFFAVRYVFSTDLMIWPVRLAKLLNLTTGAKYSEEEVMRAAERVYNLERLFLIKAGSARRHPVPAHAQRAADRRPRQGARGRARQDVARILCLSWLACEGWPSEEKLAELGLN